MKYLNSPSAQCYDEIIHPIFSSADFYIDTQMIGKLENTLMQWLWSGQTGGVVLGEARIGKTRAAEILKHNLKSRVNELVPAHHVTISNRDKKTITSVLRRIALSLGIELKQRDVADDISVQILFNLADQAQKNRTKQIVLLVDEFQRLTIHQFAAFSEMYDQLREMRVNLLTVFIGNENESSSLLEQIYLKEHEHICGRFFINKFTFRGLSSLEEVSYCLKQYDTTRHIPEDSRTTTQFFLAKDFDNGFRLASLAEPIWSIFKNHYKKSLHLQSWGTQYFFVAINSLLLDYFPKYGVDDRVLLEDMIIKSIDGSGLTSGLVGVSCD